MLSLAVPFVTYLLLWRELASRTTSLLVLAILAVATGIAWGFVMDQRRTAGLGYNLQQLLGIAWFLLGLFFVIGIVMPKLAGPL